jgi:hypothetical protein
MDVMSFIDDLDFANSYIYPDYGIKDTKQVTYISAPSNKGKSSFVAFLTLSLILKQQFLGAEYKGNKDYKIGWIDSGEQDDRQIYTSIFNYSKQFNLSKKDLGMALKNNFKIYHLRNKFTDKQETDINLTEDLSKVFTECDIVILDSLSSTTTIDLNNTRAGSLVYDIIIPLSIKHNKPIFITVHASNKSNNGETILGSSTIQNAADEIWQLSSEIDISKTFYACKFTNKKSRESGIKDKISSYKYRSGGYIKEIETKMSEVLGGIATESYITYVSTEIGGKVYNPNSEVISTTESVLIDYINSIPLEDRGKTKFWEANNGTQNIPTNKSKGLKYLESLPVQWK